MAAINTLGGIAGSLAVGFLMLPPACQLSYNCISELLDVVVFAPMLSRLESVQGLPGLGCC